MADSAYIPGVCNINKAEVAYRRKAMWFGVGLSVVILIALFAFMAPWWLAAILLFIPVFIAAIGFLQVRNKFCVAYGAGGKQNAADGNTEASVVSESDALAADKAKSRKMNLQALGMTVAIIVLVSVVISLV